MTEVANRDSYRLIILQTMNAHAAYNMFIFRKLNIETEFLKTSILFLIHSQDSSNHNKNRYYTCHLLTVLFLLRPLTYYFKYQKFPLEFCDSLTNTVY